MILYADSSALLAWLLEEPGHERVGALLADADQIIASVITPLECARTLHRGRHSGRVPAAVADQARLLLRTLQAGWTVLGLTDEIVDRALGPFPVEPVRTLDALHLATADVARQSLGALTVLSLDERVRRNAAAIGLSLAPADPVASAGAVHGTSG